MKAHGSLDSVVWGQLPISLPTQVPMDPVLIPQGMGEGPPHAQGNLLVPSPAAWASSVVYLGPSS